MVLPCHVSSRRRIFELPISQHMTFKHPTLLLLQTRGPYIRSSFLKALNTVPARHSRSSVKKTSPSGLTTRLKLLRKSLDVGESQELTITHSVASHAKFSKFKSTALQKPWETSLSEGPSIPSLSSQLSCPSLGSSPRRKQSRTVRSRTNPLQVCKLLHFLFLIIKLAQGG